MLLLASCSTKRNTVVSRGYHNVTARYNGYYYSNENIDEGVYKIERANKDNFDKILPVYIYPTPEKAKSTFPEFDKAIKKSSFCIQRHAIKDKAGNEIPSSGKWIDNNWINIGVSHFYKREFFSGIEKFEYVARSYNQSKDKYAAMLWLAKSNNEVGAVSSSEPIISLLKNEKKLPKKIRKELPALEADYYLRRGQYTEAATKLMEATRQSNIFSGLSRKKRARYAFITAQIFEMQKENKRALLYYTKTIHLKPNYDMVFYSKIKMARLLDVKRNNPERTKKDLLKMSKEFKNSDYYDVIFYTLGEIEEKEKNLPQAAKYYQKAVQTSVSNLNQKALAYLKLGEINFDLTNYQPAESYYDSAVATLPKDHPDYENIVARKKTLEVLVGHIKTIKTEDSLQRIATMSDTERDAFIDGLIAKLEKEAELKQKQKEAIESNNQLGVNANNNGQSNGGIASAGAVTFVFYNPTSLALGIADFQKKWGNRKSEDNWRRSNKAAVIDNPFTDVNDTGKAGNDIAKNSTKNKLTVRDKYKTDLPINDSLLDASHDKIINAFYSLGSIYKEELHNSKKSIAAFEELTLRYPENKYLMNTYYNLCRTYSDEKNMAKADFYKEKLVTEFPDSEFALLIKNPEAATKINGKKSEVESYYTKVYKIYRKENYMESAMQADAGMKQFGKNEFTPKFEFIKAMSLGKLLGADTLEFYLKLLVAKHPNADVTPLANDVLLAIKKQRNPDMFKPIQGGQASLDTFLINFEAEHFLIAVLPDDPKMSDAFKTNLNAFNTKYYSAKQFNLTSNLFGSGKQLIILKAFSGAQEAVSYFANVSNDPQMFNVTITKQSVEMFPILASNLPFLYKKKNPEAYKQFYEDNYKGIKPLK
jgi:tetratricopeptide (TPR) repeat protein